MSLIRKNPDSSFLIQEDQLYFAMRAFVRWLQGLFSTRAVGDFRWHENPEQSDLIIAFDGIDHGDKTNARPRILVSRGPAQFAGLGRDQTLTRNFGGGEVTFGDIIHTQFVITCIAEEGLEAQRIAYIIFRMIPVFKAAIQQAGKIHGIGNNISLSAEMSHGQVYKESSVPAWRAVRIVVPVTVNDTITVSRSYDNVLSAVNIHMNET